MKIVVESFSPKFEIVFTNNPLVKELFEADGFEVEKLVSNSKHIESTKVRNTILSGKSLSEFVPKSVEKYLKEINAQKRIKSITGKEVKQ